MSTSNKNSSFVLLMLVALIGLNNLVLAAPEANAEMSSELDAAPLLFDVTSYTVEGATFLTQSDIDTAVAPYFGKDKDFSDVQRALEAVENAYAQIGLSAVQVLLPEQQLEQGAIRFRVVESHFAKITVKSNQFVSEENVLNAIPSVRSGKMPNSKTIARELKLANENPARQMNVVLKAGDKDDEVNATVIVTDSKPMTWGASLDNTGSVETGRTRIGISFRHANLFNKDHVGSLQYQMSPEYIDRVAVLGGSYKIPLYQHGDSIEFFAGYSSVNSVVSGLTNFQGGGALLSARYNHPLNRVGTFDPRISFGLDWRNFRKIELITPAATTVLLPELIVMPVSLSYITLGKFAQSDINLNVSLSVNIAGMNKGKDADFTAYDPINLPNPDYKVLRYGVSYSRLVADEWQVRAVLNGQWSPDALIQGEQMRLGGMDAVRGFSEGFVSGEKGARWNLEGYTPSFHKNNVSVRGLAFVDGGEIRQANGAQYSISSAGVGLRASLADRLMLRLDISRILNDDLPLDPLQRVGDWRTHVGLSSTF
jgi:hemolysin activation/secretion protein